MSIFLERQEVKKQKGWGTLLKRVERVSLSVMIVLAGLAALYGIYVLMFLGTYFSIDDVVVKGHWKNMNAAELIELGGVEQGDNLFLLDVGDVHDRLVSNPWVREASVRRHLPHTLLMMVEEYEPFAILVEPDGMYYLNPEGLAFKKLNADDDKNYPFITGITQYLDLHRRQEGAERHFVNVAFGIMHSFKKLAMGKKLGIAEVHFDPIRGFSVVTDRRPMEVLLGLEHLDERIARLDWLERTIRARGGHVQYVLADEPGRVVVRYWAARSEESKKNKGTASSS